MLLAVAISSSAMRTRRTAYLHPGLPPNSLTRPEAVSHLAPARARVPASFWTMKRNSSQEFSGMVQATEMRAHRMVSRSTPWAGKAVHVHPGLA